MLQFKRTAKTTIRPVGPFDLGRLSRLHKSCFEDGWSRSDLAHLLALPGGFGLLARVQEGGFIGVDGAKGVGFALCRVVKDESELLSIGVSPDYRQRNIGTRLLQDGLARCQDAGARVMFLEVAVDNEAAQRVYVSHGFERVGVRPDYYLRPDGQRVSAYTMRCEIEQALADAPDPSLDAKRRPGQVSHTA